MTLFTLNPAYIGYAIFAVVIFTLYMAVMHVFRSNKLTIKVKGMADPVSGLE